MAKDGKPGLDLVTRLSTMPDRTTCKPVAGVKGKVGGACDADAACDSSAGVGDGWCDACAITAGQTTEDGVRIESFDRAVIYWPFGLAGFGTAQASFPSFQRSIIPPISLKKFPNPKPSDPFASLLSGVGDMWSAH